MAQENPTNSAIKTDAKQRKPLTGQAWIDAFEEFNKEVEGRDHLYPEGYEVRDDRATIYGDAEDGAA